MFQITPKKMESNNEKLERRETTKAAPHSRSGSRSEDNEEKKSKQ